MSLSSSELGTISLSFVCVCIVWAGLGKNGGSLLHKVEEPAPPMGARSCDLNLGCSSCVALCSHSRYPTIRKAAGVWKGPHRHFHHHPQNVDLERGDRNHDGIGIWVHIASRVPVEPQNLEQCPEDKSSSVDQNPCLHEGTNCGNLSSQVPAQDKLGKGRSVEGAFAAASEAWIWTPTLPPGFWMTLGKSQTSPWVSAKANKTRPQTRPGPFNLYHPTSA